MTTDQTTLRVTRLVSASAERAFDAWLDPAKIRVWMCAPARALMGTQDEIVRIDLDARAGGRFSFTVRRQGQEIEHAGEYLALERPHRLVFTWGVPRYSSEASEIALAFAPEGAGTLVTLTASPVAPEYRAQTAAGWDAILAAVAEVA